jgi:hypothetical protein
MTELPLSDPDDGETCAFCEVEAYEVVAGYSPGDYMATNLGDDPPARRLPLCAKHSDDLHDAEQIDLKVIPGVTTG